MPLPACSRAISHFTLYPVGDRRKSEIDPMGAANHRRLAILSAPYRIPAIAVDELLI
jgi:hypothetical protein